MEELVARPVGPIWSLTSGSRRGSPSRRRLTDAVVRPAVPRGSIAAAGQSLKRRQGSNGAHAVGSYNENQAAGRGSQ